MVSLDEIKKQLETTKKYWIVFTGDSITSCEWVHPNWREIVEYVLKEELTDKLDDWTIPSWGIRCFNFAYDGGTTKNILDHADDMLLGKPDLIISLMGGNDPAFGVSIAEHVDNIKKFTEKINSNGTKVVWCSSTPAGEEATKNTEYQPYAEYSMKIPTNDKLQLVDMFTIYRNFPLKKFYTFRSEENPIEGIKEGDPDFWHPNQLGNAYIAKVILKEVFGVEFDPEKYIEDANRGEKFPKY